MAAILNQLPFGTLSNLEDATKFAVERKDAEALKYILSKCGPTHRMLADKLRNMISQAK